MFSRKNRSTCRLILIRFAIRVTSMWNRKRAKKTLRRETLMRREFRQAVRLVRQASLLVLRRNSIRQLRFSIASLQSLRSIRNSRSILDEVRVVRSKHRSKKTNDRFLAKKTSNRRSNVVVVVQSFNRFCLLVW
jgi:sensor c-di-GMP phosphodiesterase-like protein